MIAFDESLFFVLQLHLDFQHVRMIQQSLSDVEYYLL